MRPATALAALLLMIVPAPAAAWPLDGYEETGIARLLAYSRAQEQLLAKGRLKPGSLLPTEAIQLRLEGRDFELPEVDADLTRRLVANLGSEAKDYGVAVLDLSDPDRPHYLEHQGQRIQNPGSVGKVAVGLAWFQALADLHPDDADARHRLLFDTEIAADGFIQSDHHTVPIWKPGDPRVVRRKLKEGDAGNLYTFFDHMYSVSSNAAAAMLQSQLLLLRHFGADYPPTPEQAEEFWKTPRSELGEQWLDAMLTPLDRNGLDRERFRQGSFFTRTGKHRVPGTNSLATPRELLRFLLLMEQGRLVDSWSSLQTKRFFYLTDRRIRYASHPALNDSAVYFKSGSLYGCKPEEGFECGKYKGNRMNYMNSLAIVETESEGRRLHYLVVVLSNVLRKNSAVAHQTFALRVHRLIEELHPPPPPPPPAAEEAAAPPGVDAPEAAPGGSEAPPLDSP